MDVGVIALPWLIVNPRHSINNKIKLLNTIIKVVTYIDY